MQPHRKTEPLPRVELRPARAEDAELMLQWRQEPALLRYQPLGPATLPQIRTELSQQQPSALCRGLGDKFQWIVLAEHRPAGWITLVVTNWDHGLAELGYSLSTPHHGKGVMPHALEMLLVELFTQTPLERIEARCAIENRASRSVLERVGFQREGYLRGYFVLRGERVDNYLYAILRREFLGLD